MRRRDGISNPKREMREYGATTAAEREALACGVSYGGNPDHKRFPKDYGFLEARPPRPGKSLCDGSGIFSRAEAEALLKAGVRKGLFSARERNSWPKNIWSVSSCEIAYEAQLENSETGVYHGYPLPADDVFGKLVVEEWKRR